MSVCYSSINREKYSSTNKPSRDEKPHLLASEANHIAYIFLLIASSAEMFLVQQKKIRKITKEKQGESNKRIYFVYFQCKETDLEMYYTFIFNREYFLKTIDLVMSSQLHDIAWKWVKLPILIFVKFEMTYLKNI